MTAHSGNARSVSRATVKVALVLFFFCAASAGVLLGPILGTGQGNTCDGGWSVLPSIASKLTAMRNLEYQVKKQALDNVIDQRLLEAGPR